MNSKIIKSTMFIFILTLTNLHADTTYQIKDLGLSSNEEISYSLATTINNKSEVTGVLHVQGVNQRDMIFLWNPANGLTEITSTHGGAPKDCNEQGQFVWLDVVVSLHESAVAGFVWNCNEIINWSGFYVSAINDKGIIVGSSKSPPGIKIKNLNAEKDCATNSLKNSNLFNTYIVKNYASFPHGINNKGEIIGQIIFYGEPKIKHSGLASGHLTSGFLCNTYNHIVTDLGINTSAVDINDNSQIILVSDYSEKGTSWLWESGIKTELWSDGLAKAINNDGIIVGKKANKAVIWENGVVKNLLDLIENPEGWETLTVGWDINDLGEIVGNGIYKGKETAFILIPQ